jgi:hypothetical protein
VQTFIPYPDFRQSAQCLDNKRLGKQRIECLQILNTLVGKSTGWQNHPAVKMWRGHERALRYYGLEICLEWTSRGFKDSCTDKLMDFGRLGVPYHSPPWRHDPRFCASHRSNLLRKDPEFYGKYGWTEPPDLPYFWPV